MSQSTHFWRRVGIIVAIVVGVVMLAAWLVLRSGSFQNYVRQKVESSASEALGAPVHINRFRLHLHSLSPSVDVYGLTIEGKAVAGVQEPEPLARVAHAQAGIHITSLWQRSFQVETIKLEQPVIHIYVDAQGHTNLPTPPASAQAGEGTDIFTLGIRHAAIDQGKIYVNDREQNLNADISGLALTVAYAARSQSYSGQLRYTQGRVQLAGLPAVTSGLELQFRASRAGVEVSSLVLTSDGAKVTAQATLSNYANPEIKAHYQLQLDLTRLRTALHLPELPQGQLQAAGTAEYAKQQLQAEGEFSSAELHLRLAALAAPVSKLRGAYQFTRGQLSVSHVQAGVMGGRLDARLTASGFGTAAGLNLDGHAQLQGAELGRVARFAPGSESTLKALGITGTVGATVEAQAKGGLEHLGVNGRAKIAGTIGATPVAAAAQMRYANGRVEIGSSRLQTPHALITAAGSLSTRAGTAAQLAVQAQTNDLGELEGMADRAGAALGKPLPRLGLAGEGKLEAQISGRLAQPTIAGQLQAARLVVRDTHWKALAGSFSASPSEVRAREISITAPQGSIKLSGSLALEHWRAQAASALTVVLTVTALPLRQLAPLLPGKLPLAGRLDASAHASGTLAAPVGQGTVRLEAAELEVNGASSGLRSAQVDVKGAAGAITAQLQAQLEAGSVKAEGVWHPATGAYRAQLSARALELAKIPALGGAHVRGVVRIEGSGEGTVAAPAFKLQVSAPQMAAEGQSIEHLEASLDLQARHLNATLRATTLGAALEAKGAVALHDDWPATASLDAPAIALGPVLAALAPQVGGAIQGETAVQATLSGPLRDPRQLQVAITVPQFHMKYAGALTLAAARPIQAHLAQGVVELEPAEFTGSGTDFHVQGTVPIPALGAAAAAAMQVNLSGNINLKLAEAFAPDLAAGGAVTVEVRATGALAHPALTGVIQISDARLSNPAWPVAVQAGQGALRLHDGRLDLTGFTASVGGGHVTVGGGMTLTPKLAFNFTVAAEQIRLRVPAGLREMVSAMVNLTGSPQAGLLSGRVQVENVSAVPGYDFSALTAELARNTVAVGTVESFLNDLRLEVAVTTPNQVAVVSRDFSIHANANVNVRGTAQVPVVLGRVDLTSGDLIFRGNRYVIEAGTLDFVNPIRTVPTVNVTADTSIEQYDLHLHFQGPVDNLRTSYTSDPALPPADIINLLAFGQTTEAGAANPLPGNLGAETLVASAVTGQITDRVEKIAGISHLSVDPVLGGGQQQAGARITLQQRVTANLYVTISTDVAGTERNVIKIQYKLSPRVSVSGVRKQNGGYGANLQFKKVWH